MGIPNRIYKMSKAYLDQVRDRIDAELTEREQASRELENSLDPGASAPARRRDSSAMNNDVSNAEEMMRRAEERISSARRELESRNELNRNAAAGAGDTGAGATSKPSGTGRVSSGSASSASSSAPLQQDDPNGGDYRVLGVPVGSDLAVVQTAYEQLSRRCDPRRFPDNSAEQKDAERILVRVNAAYEALRKRLDPTENRFGKLELE